ncbi:hypothetical protein ACOSQ2_010866 [Xanthoceras sorbifolium]
MNLFKLPQKLIHDLHRLSARFWWGSGQATNKIHWCRWDLLCKNKFNGGLGFWDLRCFNQTMVAKQCWHLIENPSSLVGKVLKSIYFHRSSFLDALLGSPPSYV